MQSKWAADSTVDFQAQLQQGFLLAPLSVCVGGMVMVRPEGPSPLLGVSDNCF
jgi:hypothetical protein